MDAGSKRLASVQPAIIPIIDELVSQNPGTISLGQGVVHYPPPAQAREEFEGFWAEATHHRYGSVAGIERLRDLITNKLISDNKIDLLQRFVLVTAGSNMGFLNVVLSITDPGDEIILLIPYFFNQEMAIHIAGCNPVLVETDAYYQPVLARIEQAITSKTRAVVTVSPNNPTGAVYSEQILHKINSLCLEHNIYHISDEAYEYFTYENCLHFSPASIDGSSGHTIAMYSLSKSYGFASWRIGYVVAPAELQTSLEKMQDTNVICPPIASQFAAVGALEVGKKYIKEHVRELGETRKSIFESLEEIKHKVKIVEPMGAFYMFLDLEHHNSQDMELVRSLIEQYGVALIPGAAFGVRDRCCLRLSYGAIHPSMVSDGISRLIRGITELA
ncbi:MAG: aspartate aminotransferase [Acidiferrobacteraceae bacterium]|nr:aspartate aminotransferase [Acidiferrobacteraceae bacterium]